MHVKYSNEIRQAVMDAKAHWDLRGTVRFLDTPASGRTLQYYFLIGPDVQDEQATVAKYQAMFKEKVAQHGVAKTAACLAIWNLPSSSKSVTETDEHGPINTRTIPKDHTELKHDTREAIEQCQAESTGSRLVVHLLGNRSIPMYSAFKDVTDCVLGLQFICVTESKNLGKTAYDLNLGQYFSNVMMKVNLKERGMNHTVCDGPKGEGRLRGKLYHDAPAHSVIILGADVTHPSGSSLTGCPSLAALVGSTDYDGARFLGSMRLQDKSKNEVSLPF